jgi:hypothetical protein
MLDIPPPSPSTTTSTTTSTVHGDAGRDEDDEYENEENGSVVDTDLSGEAAFYSSAPSHQLLRSASEEALPVSLSCDFSFNGKLDKKEIKLSSDSFNGTNKVISTSTVFPTTSKSFIADTTATTTMPASTLANANTTTTTSSDSKQLLHTSQTLDRTNAQTISRFTITLVPTDKTSQTVKTETTPDEKDISVKKSAKKKKKKYPEYKV